VSRVFVCVATHEPAIDLLARQLESLSAQRHAEWTAVVFDDGSSARSARRSPPSSPASRACDWRPASASASTATSSARWPPRPPEVPYLALCDQD
jgi:hypothetical protein